MIKQRISSLLSCSKGELCLQRCICSQICVLLLFFFCISVRKLACFNKSVFWASLRPATLFKKETLTQVFSCEFYEIFKNNFFLEHLRTAASKTGAENSLGNLARGEKCSVRNEKLHIISFFFFNLFKQVEIFSPGPKYPYNQPFRCLTGF